MVPVGLSHSCPPFLSDIIPSDISPFLADPQSSLASQRLRTGTHPLESSQSNTANCIQKAHVVDMRVQDTEDLFFFFVFFVLRRVTVAKIKTTCCCVDWDPLVC